MSRRRKERDPEPGLFDLPLDGPVVDGEESEPAAPPAPGPSPPATVPTAPAAPARRTEVSLSARYLGGLADLAVHLALVVGLLFGARLLGVPAGLDDGPALLLFLLVFSFLYTVVPLAFWGRTAGMAWAGLVARTPAGESLTFPQTALRWLGAVLSVVLLGIPVLPAALTGRSLADRLSGSVILPS